MERRRLEERQLATQVACSDQTTPAVTVETLSTTNAAESEARFLRSVYSKTALLVSTTLPATAESEP